MLTALEEIVGPSQWCVEARTLGSALCSADVEVEALA